MVTLLDCGPTWETPRLEYPYNQRFILDTFVNSNICFYGALHHISSLCLDEATGVIPVVARKFSHLSSADITRVALK